MRIVQLLPELNEGGVERGVVELNRELVRRGHDSVVISRGGRLTAQIVADGGRHISFDVASKSLLTIPGRVLRLRRELRRLAPDVIHARSRLPAWLALLANRPLRIPFVTTVHGFNSVNRYSRVMTCGDRVVCVSGSVREYIRQHYGVPEEKIVIIPRGVDLDLFDPARLDRPFMEDFGRVHRLSGRYVVTNVGRITQLKDFETFIRAIGLASAERPEILGLIVGGVHGDRQGYYATLEKLVESLGLSGYIHFVGSQAKVAEIYALSQAVVVSSKKPESFGRAAAEALAMNVPVIATAHGGVLDIVRNGRDGFLVACRDSAAMSRAMLAADSLRPTDSREWIAGNFSLAKMVDGYEGVYEGLKG